MNVDATVAGSQEKTAVVDTLPIQADPQAQAPIDEGNVQDVVNVDEDNPHKRSGRKGKRTSDVWNHFKNVSGPPESAKCKYCGSEYLCSSKRHGISNLKIHLSKCEKSPLRKLDKGQKTLLFKSIKKEEGTSSGPVLRAVNFNIAEARTELAKMVIIDELSFRSVEGEGFKNFVESLQPLFKVPSRVTVQRDCMNIYKEERMSLKKVIKNEMVCITTDTWSSLQNINYMCITAHWIDIDWKLNKRIISFVQIPSHKGEVIGLAIELILLDWGIEKLFTVTVDNASSNDGALKHLKLVTKD